VDATGKAVFAGAIDSHFHVGIYSPFSEDAVSESCSAASGGATSILSYFRTCHNHLNKTGPFREIFPGLMEKSRGSFVTDYSYHIAIMSSEQLDEIEWLVRECGVTTFKYYIFYKSLDLSGSKRSDGYLMLKDTLDFSFLYRFMKEVARMNQEMQHAGGCRLSVHCINPEIITATVEEVKANPTGNLMKDYSDGRPDGQEELAVKEIGTMARATGCPINLLHL
jgi:dihydroorotase-like cyclic amidohydrolase